nr:EOG090X0ADZ [Lepidurus arcticus]
MSLNTAHANNGVLIHAGEYILLFSDNVNMEFSGQSSSEFKGSKNGRLYLTSHRMIFNNKNAKDPMQSFSFPFVAMQDVQLEQPMFGANYLKGKVRAQPNGKFIGEVKYKLHFNNGGAIDFGQGMLQAVSMAAAGGGYGANQYQPAYPNAPPPPYADAPPAYYPNIDPGYRRKFVHNTFVGPLGTSDRFYYGNTVRRTACMPLYNGFIAAGMFSYHCHQFCLMKFTPRTVQTSHQKIYMRKARLEQQFAPQGDSHKSSMAPPHPQT